MECGLGNPARAGRQQRYFAPHPPWLPWLLFFRSRFAVGKGHRARARNQVEMIENHLEILLEGLNAAPRQILGKD